MKIILREYPLPPSENAIYRPKSKRELAFEAARGITSRGKRLTAVGREYYGHVESWKNRNYQEIVMADAKLEKWFETGHVLAATFVLCLNHERVWTQKGLPKRNDATNRIKILQDTVSKLLRFDDTLIFNAMIEKVNADNQYPEGVVVILEPMKARTATTFIASIGGLE